MAALNQMISPDIGDSSSNAKYKQEIEKLSEQIASSIKTIDKNGNGSVSKEELLTFLQTRVGPGKPLDMVMFQKFFAEVDVNNDGQIDIREFTNQYIRNTELIKMSLENQKNELETEKVRKVEYERKILEAKNEKLNKEGMCLNACISIEIGTLTPESNYLSGFDSSYFQLVLDGKEQKTSTHSLNDLVFNEKITFNMSSLQQILALNFFNKNTQISSHEIPFTLLQSNKEIGFDLSITDNNNNILFTLQPKILLITSYYQLYQSLYDQTNLNIDNYQKKLDQLSIYYEAFSAPFKPLLMNVSNQSVAIGNSAFENQVLDKVENLLKSALKKRDIEWASILKIILYISIIMSLFTTLAKPDFVSLFIEIIIVIIINTKMSQTLFDHFFIFVGMILFSIAYDFIDYFCLRQMRFKSMKVVNSVVALFSLIAFIGKILALLCMWIQKIKFSKSGVAH